jgi:hypothetical protein
MNAVPSGSYSLTISHAGYRVFLIDAVPMKAGYETAFSPLHWCDGFVY